jgi:hypothetical protein
VAPDAGALSGGEPAVGILLQEIGLHRLRPFEEVALFEQPGFEERLVVLRQLTQQILSQQLVVFSHGLVSPERSSSPLASDLQCPEAGKRFMD